MEKGQKIWEKYFYGFEGSKNQEIFQVLRIFDAFFEDFLENVLSAPICSIRSFEVPGTLTDLSVTSKSI